MILVFPSLGVFPDGKKDDDPVYIRSFNKNRFNSMVQKKVAAGWYVCQMTSSFRTTPFGGIVTYFCELRRDSKG
jgi:hypothetical protein